MDLKALIRDIPDFPQPGIMFRDITTLLKDPEGWQYTINTLTEHSKALSPNKIVGIESRGFILGAPLAYALNIGFVPVRKPGKLPYAARGIDYDLEYGSDRLEIHEDALSFGDRVLVVDDLIATGGTAAAAASLVQHCGADLVGMAFVVELLALQGRQYLPDVPIVTLVEY
jgi:adenine phosphoribosyltransferase